MVVQTAQFKTLIAVVRFLFEKIKGRAFVGEKGGHTKGIDEYIFIHCMKLLYSRCCTMTMALLHQQDDKEEMISSYLRQTKELPSFLPNLQ